MEGLVIFALPAKLPKELLKNLNTLNRIVAPRGQKSLINFSEKIITYKFIIGIGDYSGKDQENVKLETQCRNKNQTLLINNFLKPFDGIVFSKEIGNSYCNLISYQIMEKINKSNLNNKYSFIHIPKSMEANYAAEKINKMIESFLSAKL